MDIALSPGLAHQKGAQPADRCGRVAGGWRSRGARLWGASGWLAGAHSV